MTNVRSMLCASRPPYVEFETRPVEDRQATIDGGKVVVKDVDYAIIRALGSKDTVEKEAAGWLEHIEAQAVRGAYPRDWAKFFREQYNEWKNGGDPAKVNGLYVRNWAAISRSQAEGLISAGIHSVEDLAAANEEALRRIGMGSRVLQQRAQAWLETAAQNGSAEELASLRQENADLKSQVDELLKDVDTLAAAIEGQGEKKRRA